jgi:hypothetical protein
MFRILGIRLLVERKLSYYQRAPAPLAIAIEANAATATAMRM